MLAQLDVDVPLCVHSRKHASRGDSLVPHTVHGWVEKPQIERHDDVDVLFAMHES